MMMSELFFVDQNNISQASPLLIGGKGYNLARLGEAGQNVPGWYGITTRFQRRVFEESNLYPIIRKAMASLNVDDQPATIDGKLGPLKDAILGLEFSPEVEKELLKQHHAVINNESCFSVRSSAIDEDSGEASFAGLHDSFLFVKAEGLLDKIRMTWASAFNTRAIVFRLKHEISLEGISLAVVVQRMVEAEVSGIIFTANPNNGNIQEVLISSLFGAGEGIVSAGLDADLFTYSKQFGDYATDVTGKNEQLVFDRKNGTGLTRTVVPEGRRKQASLNDGQIRDIARAAMEIENYFRKPQDIEFSIDQAGHLYILQARPVTTVAEYGPAVGNRIIWDNSNIIESYSGPTSPMTFSFIRHAYTIVYHCFSQVMGIAPQEVHKNRHVFENMLGLINGQVYYNIINWYKLVRLFPGFHYNKSFMESMMGLKDKVDLEDNAPAAGWGRRYFIELPKLLSLLFRSLRNFSRMKRLVAEFGAHFDHHFNNWSARNFDTMPPHELMKIYRDMEDKLLWNWKTPIINDFYVMIYYGALKACCQKWCRDESGSLQNDLICGEGDIESTKPTKMLMLIAQRIKDNRHHLGLFLNHTPEELAKIIPEDPQFRVISEQISSCLDQYGFRCINELKLEEPSLRETPEFVYQMIQNYLRMENDDALNPQLMEEREKQIRMGAEQKAFMVIGEGWNLYPRKTIFKWILGNARLGVKNRENMRFARTKIYGLLRELINAAGKHFAREEIILDPRDIYYLTIDEIWDYVKGTAVTTDLKGLVELRKSEFSQYRSEEAAEIADHFETYGLAYHKNLFRNYSPSPEESSEEGLRGTGCCPGEVIGRVRIVRSPKDNLTLNGEILVAARTDPGWVPLYPAVSGILIERGSILSHSAIVAREMGIPTIVGIPNLIKSLEDGQEVCMNGTTGIVELVE
ncbi:MAG: PEP/pyruvate-binding domain-containing protein [Thermodesulfobacteriota bacterium]